LVDRSEPVLTTIIVTHASSLSIIGCLSHLRESTFEIPHEIIVVDNNSTDNTPSIVRQKYPEAKVVTNHSNSGFANACNQGAALASGRYLLFLNPDAFVDSDSITELIRVSDGSNKTGFVSGRLRYPDGRFQASCREFSRHCYIFPNRVRHQPREQTSSHNPSHGAELRDLYLP